MICGVRWGLIITNEVDICHCRSTTAYNIWPYVSNLKCKQNMQIKYYDNGEPNSLFCFCWFVFSIKPLLLSFAHCGESICLPLMWHGFKSQCPNATYGLSLVFSLAPNGFFPGTPVLPSPQIQIYVQIQLWSGTQRHIWTSY